jgi:hypothetical protein
MEDVNIFYASLPAIVCHFGYPFPRQQQSTPVNRIWNPQGQPQNRGLGRKLMGEGSKKMDEEIVHQILAELLSSLEPLDTQSAAVVQFLKAKSIATDEELAPYFEQAGNASSVRWRAALVRIGGLISSAMKSSEMKSSEPPRETKATATSDKSSEAAGETSEEKGRQSGSEPAQPSKAANSDSGKPLPTAADNHENKRENESSASPEVAKEAARKDAA